MTAMVVRVRGLTENSVTEYWLVHSCASGGCLDHLPRPGDLVSTEHGRLRAAETHWHYSGDGLTAKVRLELLEESS